MSKSAFRERDEDVSTHQSHLKRMVAFYARTASNYNAWHCNPEDHSSHNYAVRAILSLLEQTGGKSLLDVCCGTGRATKAALDAGFDARGIDISRELIDVGIREIGIPPDRLEVGDATRLPYPDQSFDVACVLGALHHSARPHTIVSELMRVARNGIVISDEGNHIPGGVKSILVRLGIFEPVYRIFFRRAPRTARREGESDTDGPAFLFSVEEVIPMVQARFAHFKCRSFYSAGKIQVSSNYLPRLFARHAVISAWK